METRILVIEDDPDCLSFFDAVLSQGGCVVEQASSGGAGLRRLQEPEGRPDVIILDVGLPDMDGLDLCRVLKRDPATHRIPVVILSARTENAMRLKAAASEADMVLSKPIGSAELIQAVGMALVAPRVERRGALNRGGLELDPVRGAVSFAGRVVADLGPRLFDLLYLLVEHSPHPIGCRRIMASMRMDTRESEVYVLVSRLRTRLRKEFGRDIIATVPEKGYSIELPVVA